MMSMHGGDKRGGSSTRAGNESEEEDYEIEIDGLQDKASWRTWFRSLVCRQQTVPDSARSRMTRIVRNAAATANENRGRFVIRPDNWWYMVWTQFILIWAVYSSFFTPMEFGFFRGLPENLFLLDIAGQLAFLVDIVVRFFVAFRDTQSYTTVDSHKRIALRYLKSRFVVDFLGCLPLDAIYRFCGRKEPVRYLLWIRLSRALRVTEFFEKLEKDIRINYLFTRIVKLLVVELYCTHAAACIFYYLATTMPASQEGYTWIGSLTMGDYSYSHFRDIDLWKRYFTSLYFAIVTMATVGSGDIHAVNVREMLFVMAYVSFDMILGAYLLGNMTALIVKGSKTEKFRDRMAELISYMNRNKLGRQISNEIKHHVRSQHETSYTEAAFLQDIPVSIRAKISQKLYGPYIKEVSLFKGCSSGFLKQIATRVHEEIFLPGEVILEEENMVDQLYIVCNGKLKRVGSNEDEIEGPLMHLQTNDSFGEIPLLCNTPLAYTVQVVELCRLVRLDKQSFINILEIYFSDGQIILNNLLEGKGSNLRNKILESDITLYIGKHEAEVAMRVNCAAYNGDLYQLRRLIEAGADPNKTDYDGRSPLHFAASKGYEDITDFLIELRVNIHLSDNHGNTPLLEAIKNGHDGVTSLLVKAGALLTVEDAGGCLCMTVVRRDLNFLKRLLANGINPNAKNYDSRTPLHLAASEGLYSMTNLLLEAGASVLAKDRWGNTPLDEARIGGNKNLIKLLEEAMSAQLSEFSSCSQEIRADKMRQRKCTVFPFHPWDSKEERKQGVVLWIPKTIEELIETAMDQLKCSSGSCILSENGAKITNIDMISDEEKLFLVAETI
ncbi:hypothetical protein VitviT2T_016712 [Vitis vinifera]|uniref:Potassium channel n=2 Tax=Vitis vinifera TaxID=29760 RepID=A0ABY9CSA0_VITVI|eukprot:XP_002282398.2 PREDICTED: potassium channel SKOR [Vitis vinifera]